VVVVVLVVDFVEELPPLPPHPATATVLASTASSVSIAVSGVLLMGRAPILARCLRRSPYQAPVAIGHDDEGVMSVAVTAGPDAIVRAS
jgi:hypothetical protein